MITTDELQQVKAIEDYVIASEGKISVADFKFMAALIRRSYTRFEEQEEQMGNFIDASAAEAKKKIDNQSSWFKRKLLGPKA